MTNLGNEKSPNRVHRNIVPIVPVPPMKSTQTIEYQSIRAGTIKISLFRGPIFQHFIVVFAAESPYLWYRQKNPKNARMDCPTGVYDKFYGHNRTDEAWQAQNDTVRLLHTE